MLVKTGLNIECAGLNSKCDGLNTECADSNGKCIGFNINITKKNRIKIPYYSEKILFFLRF